MFGLCHGLRAGKESNSGIYIVELLDSYHSQHHLDLKEMYNYLQRAEIAKHLDHLLSKDLVISLRYIFVFIMLISYLEHFH